MSSRPILPAHKVVDDGNMSSNITSLVTSVQNVSMVNYTCSWSGTAPVGALQIQGSNDYELEADGSERSAGTWNNLSGAAGNISGNTGNGGIDIMATSYKYLRAVYTRTSGVGTLQVTVSGKVN